MTLYVFAYGTLRAGEINDLARHAQERGLPAPRLVGQARVPGRLYDFGDWPGLVDQANGPAVLGEVYEIDELLLPLMDEIEGVEPEVDSCFIRRSTVLAIDGQPVDCLYYPIDPRHLGDAISVDGDDWVAYRVGRGATK
jgi:gamma-glutamylcyclotransferase (GGCT)/AIG2-like uncharacterized protein YtfP